jgi:hypothetical protein
MQLFPTPDIAADGAAKAQFHPAGGYSPRRAAAMIMVGRPGCDLESAIAAVWLSVIREQHTLKLYHTSRSIYVTQQESA